MSATLTSPALEKFDALDWPIRTVENWRFGSWKEANLSGIELLGAGASADLPARSKALPGLFSKMPSSSLDLMIPSRSSANLAAPSPVSDRPSSPHSTRQSLITEFPSPLPVRRRSRSSTSSRAKASFSRVSSSMPRPARSCASSSASSRPMPPPPSCSPPSM